MTEHLHRNGIKISNGTIRGRDDYRCAELDQEQRRQARPGNASTVRLPAYCEAQPRPTTMKFLCSTVALSTLLAISYAVIAADVMDPVIGTWRLNAAKSQVRAGPPLAQSDTRTYTATDGGIALTWKRLSSDGKEIVIQSTSKYDSKNYPITGSPDVDTGNGRRIDANNAETTLKRMGKVVGTGKRTVSKDGRTLTVAVKVTNAKGDVYDATLVYDRE
jgi:hypothetical protein